MHASRIILGYSKPLGRDLDLWRFLGASAVAVGLVAACFALILLYGHEEPHLGPAKWSETLAFSVMPVVLVASWLLWAALALWVVRPRWRALLLLTVAVPVAILSSNEVRHVRTCFLDDQATVEGWYSMAAEEAVGRHLAADGLNAHHPGHAR